jgi:CofH subfamily radical SAM domain protein
MTQELLSQENTRMRSIAEKVVEKKRLTTEEGLYLLKTPHQEELFALADFVRKQKVGDVVRYTSTLHLYPTNICEVGCPFCSFHAKDDNGYFNTPEMLEEKFVESLSLEISEVHIVGGLYRKCNLPYYQKLFRKIRKRSPNIHIKALTAVEIDFLARLHNMEHQEVLSCLIKEGLCFLPGGGAEILDTKVRSTIAPKKCSANHYLAIHKIAHSFGLASNITMLFNHIEENEEIIVHLGKVRTLQDETGLIQTFIPIPYLTKNGSLCSIPLKKKNMKTIFAVSRLMLDNVSHIKALWNYLGILLAKEILLCGADDLGSTSINEQVAASASEGKNVMTAKDLARVIREMGRIPNHLHSRELL